MPLDPARIKEARHDRPFRKTHDLIELGRQCLEIDPTLADLLAEAAPLTEYASMFRYPGDAAAPSGPEVKSAQATARAVHEAVLVRLPEQVG